MSDEFLSKLPERESKALSLCGITTAKQLARISPQNLLKELEQARAYFPDDITEDLLNEERLTEISEDAVHHALSFPETAAEESTRLASERINQQVKMFGAAPKEEENDFYVGHAPVNESFFKDIKQEALPISNLDQAETERGKSMRFSTIRCGHPITIYFGAFATLLLVPAGLLFAGLLLAVMGGTVTQEKMGYGMIAVFAILVFYFLMNFHARCTVCHMHIFSLRKYPRNKYALRIPLLGCTIPTALRILFTMKFTCPACGTKLKLSGRNPHHHHRSNAHDLYKSRHHHH